MPEEKQENSMNTFTDTPTRGQVIYVPTRGSDMSPMGDFAGGRATVSRVRMGTSCGKETPFVIVEEFPGRAFNWEILAQRQADYHHSYGERVANPTPDFCSRDDGFSGHF
jgi:hypothetical protein